MYLYFKIDYSTYFKDVIQYYYCQFSPVFAPLINGGVGWIGIRYKEKYETLLSGPGLVIS